MQKRSRLIFGVPVRSPLGGSVQMIQAILGNLKFGREPRILNLAAPFAPALQAVQEFAGHLVKLIHNF
jgi:hypothetical protein